MRWCAWNGNGPQLLEQLLPGLLLLLLLLCCSNPALASPPMRLHAIQGGNKGKWKDFPFVVAIFNEGFDAVDGKAKSECGGAGGKQQGKG